MRTCVTFSAQENMFVAFLVAFIGLLHDVIDITLVICLEVIATAFLLFEEQALYYLQKFVWTLVSKLSTKTHSVSS